MAQGKVTDFFQSRKRNPDARPVKRQKLRELDDIFTLPHDAKLADSAIKPLVLWG